MLECVGAVIAPTAVITGLFYYFGWVRTQAVFAYFGVDIDLIEYSPSDYVLRSSGITFDVLIRVAFVALILVGLHRCVVLWAMDMLERNRARWLILRSVVIAHVVGVVLAAVVGIAVLAPNEVGRPLGLILPLLLMVSVALLGYVTHLRLTYAQLLAQAQRCVPRAGVANQEAGGHDEGRALACESDAKLDSDTVNKQSLGNRFLSAIMRVVDMWSSPRVEPYPRVRALILLALGFVSILWAVSLYAHQVGADEARSFAAGVPSSSAIILYSVDRIAINGPGVRVAEIVQPGNKYHYQYSGIRLLARSADKYLLLPKYWQRGRGRGRVFIIREDSSIRMDVAVQ